MAINRLILIGNGFDLAHGLKTSYRDFMTWYMCTAFENFILEGNYTDPLIEIRNKYAGMQGTYNLKPESVQAVLEQINRNDLQSIIYHSNFFNLFVLSWLCFRMGNKSAPLSTCLC